MQGRSEPLQPELPWLQSIFDLSPAVIYLKDPEGRYLLVNRRYEELFHVTREELAGKTDHEFFPHDFAEGFRRNDLEVLATREPREWEEVAPHDDGPHTYLSLKFPLFDSSGIPFAVCGISTDISDRKRAHENRVRLSALREELSASLGWVDASLHESLQRCTNALARHFDAAIARIWTFAEGTTLFELTARSGLDTPFGGTAEGTSATAFDLGSLLVERKASHTNTLRADPRLIDKEWAEREGLVSFAGYPLVVGDNHVGLMAIFGRRPFDDDELDTLASVADALGQGIARKRLEAERVELLARERAARAAVESSERRYRFLIKAIPQIVWAAHADGQVDYFNPRWTLYTGLLQDKSRGLGWQQAVYPDDLPRYLEHWSRARASSEPYSLDLRLRRADGSYRWHLARGLAVRSKDGHILRWLGTFTDIDDQKRAEGALLFLAEASAVLSSSLDYETTLSSVARLAVPHIADWCVVDMAEPDGSLRRLAVAHSDFSKADLAKEIAKRYPLSPDEPFGPPRVLRDGVTEYESEMIDTMLVASARDAEHLAALRRLGLRSYICTPLVARGRKLGAITLVMAASGRKYGAGDLPLAEDLARRAAMAVDNARLHREAQAARLEAEAANKAKDEFLAVLSHELRTPLTPALAGASAMLDDPDSPPEVRPTLEMVRRNIELEARLIDDLLDVTRIRQGKLRLNRETVDAHTLVLRALGICRADIHTAGLHLNLDLAAPNHHASADPARLQQVFWNLIKNAIKFTPSGGAVSITSRNDLDHRELIVEIADSGIGIEPEALPSIFDAFEQGETATNRRFGGLGLGLAISRNVVEQHGGRLTAASAGKGCGSSFSVAIATVPAPPPPTSGAPSRPNGHLAVPPLRILLVEDSADTLQVLSRLLRKSGHSVTTADSVNSALELAAQESFDLLISDLGLPDGSGLNVMRSLAEMHAIPGIALSGFGTEEDLRKSREAGFVAHLTKPVTYSTLEAAIHRIVSEAGASA